MESLWYQWRCVCVNPNIGQGCFLDCHLLWDLAGLTMGRVQISVQSLGSANFSFSAGWEPAQYQTSTSIPLNFFSLKNYQLAPMSRLNQHCATEQKMSKTFTFHFSVLSLSILWYGGQLSICPSCPHPGFFSTGQNYFERDKQIFSWSKLFSKLNNWFM